MKAIFGNLYDGQSSARQACSIHLDDAGFLHVHGASFAGEPLADVRIAPRVGATARMLYFSSGHMFETSDNNGMDALARSQRGNGWFVAHRWETSLGLIAVSVLIFVLMIPLFAFVLIPKASESIAMRLPADVLDSAGKATLEVLDRQYLSASGLDEARRQQLADAFTALLPQGKEYRLLFRDGGGIGANALALPDNSVVVTDQLVALAEDDDEIIAVLLHEIGHLEHRHALKRTIQGSGLAIMAVWLTGDLDSISATILSAPTLLLALSFSREHEREADHYAIDKMRESGRDPAHLASILERLTRSDKPVESEEVRVEGQESESKKKVYEYLQSHPATAERKAYILEAAGAER